MITLECKPNHDGTQVTIVIENEEAKPIGLQNMLKTLVHFVKNQCDENGLDLSSAAISPEDKCTRLDAVPAECASQPVKKD